MANYDDRRHGQGIRRRQGGRSSVYHDDSWYPGSFRPPPETEEEADVLAQQQAFESESKAPWLRLSRPVGSDSATGAY